jgi:hypothetical protein
MASRRILALACGVALIGTVGIAGCGGDSGNSASVKDQPKETPTTQVPGSESSFVGLTKSAAIAAAKAQDRPWRIGREDTQQYALTQDYIPNRVTFEIDNGRVTKATFG